MVVNWFDFTESGQILRWKKIRLLWGWRRREEDESPLLKAAFNGIPDNNGSFDASNFDRRKARWRWISLG